MSESYFYGGQAVMEGVMMRGRKTFAVACRAPNGEILIYEEELNPGPVLRRVRNLAFIRGAVVLWDTLILGMRSLMFSANVGLQEEPDADTVADEIGGFPWITLAVIAAIGVVAVWFAAPPLGGLVNGLIGREDLEPAIDWGARGIIASLFALVGVDIVRGHRQAVARAASGTPEEPEMMTGAILWITVAISLLASIGLFFVVPVAVSAWLERFIDSHLLVNIVEGLLRLALLIGYLMLIAQAEDIRRVFSYHGAEHKTINAYEKGLPLDVENIRPQPLEHIRCGTAFLLLVVLISVVVFSLLGRPSLFWLITSRIVLVPVIAAIGFEVIRFGARHSESTIMKLVLTPGLVLQRLTTREPDDDMLEVAVAAFKRVAARDGVFSEEQLDDGAVLVDDLGRPIESVVPVEPAVAD
ncbi:hypothetical protein BH23CHL2_BH23CHL2_02340 [soil metagenome]